LYRGSELYACARAFDESRVSSTSKSPLHKERVLSIVTLGFFHLLLIFESEYLAEKVVEQTERNTIIFIKSGAFYCPANKMRASKSSGLCTAGKLTVLVSLDYLLAELCIYFT
jgi:hypothetical protein